MRFINSAMKLMGRKTVKGRTTSAPKTVKSTTAAGAAPTAASTVEAATPAKQPPTYEEIARRSYELYLARGSEPGHAEEDWLAAERELSA
jgi:hypothetical protein